MTMNSVSSPRPDRRTPRQMDTEKVRLALTRFATDFPTAGEHLFALGNKGLDRLADRIVLALHPKVTSGVFGHVDRLYDLPVGTMLQ